MLACFEAILQLGNRSWGRLQTVKIMIELEKISKQNVTACEYE